ncbi:MAG: DNA-binding response regulator, partial [Acidobacteria bacterium]
MRKQRVLLADDHAVVRKGLRFVLAREPAIEVVGEAADGHQAVKLAAELKPDIVILDIAMPNLNGIEATERIVRENSKVAV